MKEVKTLKFSETSMIYFFHRLFADDDEYTIV